MKNRVFATLGSLTLLTAAAAFAQSRAVLEVDIPFEFRVGTTILPAGHYEVRPQLTPGILSILSIQCVECNARVMILTNGIEGRNTPATGKLVFNRYDKTYFLSTVWTPGYSQGRLLKQLTAELEFVRKSAAVPPVVAVALETR